MIRLVVPGSVNQLTGGYRYDSALLKALQWSGVDAEAIELPDLADPEALQTLVKDLQHKTPGPCHLIVDGLALTELHRHHATLLKRFSRSSSGKHSLVALVHHPLCDETGHLEIRQADLQATEAEALLAVDLILTTSSHTSRRVQTLFSPSQVVVPVEPGVDRPARLLKKEHSFDPHPLKLLCVASLVPRKGQDVLLRALYRLPFINLSCTFVGLLDRDPDYVRHIRELVVELGLSERVEIEGALADEALEQRWQAADVLVLPSWYEGYGMVLDEAAVRGVPVLTTTGGALAATFREGSGLQVPPGDVQAMAAAIERFATDTALLSNCRTFSLTYSQTQRTWEEAAAEVIMALEMNIPQPRRVDLFNEQWLAMREPFDHQARSGNEPEQALLRWAGTLQARGRQLTMLDLGAGRGSNLRHLDTCLAQTHSGLAKAEKIAIDHDPSLLQAIEGRADTQTLQLDLADTTRFESAVTALCKDKDAVLLTGSALLDLVSMDWMNRLVELAAQQGAALLFTLSVDGSRTICPAEPLDAEIQQLFNDHQQSRGLPGPEAAAYFAAQARKGGLKVTVGASDWQVDSAAGAADRQLLTSLLTGWREAVREQLADRHTAADAAQSGAQTGNQLIQIDAWCQRRMSQIQSGTLRLRLGHCDVFARPAGMPKASSC